MKFIKKKAEQVSITIHGGDITPDYRCPTCGMGVAPEYVCCPYCTQKLYFESLTEKFIAANRQSKEAEEGFNEKGW